MKDYVTEEQCIQRTGLIENRLIRIEDKIDKLTTNCIPHLSEEIALIKEQLKGFRSKNNNLGKREYLIISGLITIITLLIRLL